MCSFPFFCLLLFVVLLANNGSLMQNFSEDPVKYLRYITGVEFADDGDGIVNRVINRYFARNVTFQNQLTQLEKVFAMLLTEIN